jgi:hypothetical protein
MRLDGGGHGGGGVGGGKTSSFSVLVLEKQFPAVFPVWCGVVLHYTCTRYTRTPGTRNYGIV